MNEVSVSLLGTCIIRDCLAIAVSPMIRNQITVQKFIQGYDPVVAGCQRIPQLQEIPEEEYVFGSPWERRCLNFQIRKPAPDETWQADYLVIDFAALAYPLAKCNEVPDAYLVFGRWFEENRAVLESRGVTFEKVLPWDLPDEFIRGCLDRYADWILSAFPPEKVIFCETLNALDYRMTEAGGTRLFLAHEDLAKRNEFIRKFTPYFLERLKGCTVIGCPAHLLANDKHKWGVLSLHFCDEYYTYLHCAIDVSVSDLSEEEKAKKREALKAECEKAFLRIREHEKARQEIASLKKASALSPETIADFKETERLRTQLRGAEERHAAEKRKWQTQLDAAREESRKILVSKTYRIGNLFTCLPKKIRDAKRKKNGSAKK